MIACLSPSPSAPPLLDRYELGRIRDVAAATDDRLELYWLHDTVAIHTGLVPLAVRDQLHPVAVPG